MIETKLSETVRYINADCLEYLATIPDNHFQLAIVDVPYGIGEDGSKNASRGKAAKAQDYVPFEGGDKTAPSLEYWTELFRVSQNQIVWGANHFISKLPIDSPCWIVWDKQNGTNDFADCELAWTSFPTAVRRFVHRWNGMLQQNPKDKEVRIHPTQKPVQLYRWLMKNYAMEGDRILDTHLGSGSSGIAAHYEGLDFTGVELSEHYFNEAVKRFNLVTTKQEIQFPD